ncbi:hypothetical protein IWT140_00569 [Secundilactobacillus pentosiphilus]|uniref:DUF4428 domain-containing protein n=1 Tax=Secundilactobacillus pentosiphilus TaxID=1714682 RepID=A0A1Z5INF5_9LACO|nr:DUF4428 domain-containing protein [Secundilactobacillus pentosiphilus]GAX02971.1 hypothetical protein IWT140_00569 [Secundilactobacillus pentosiphilus]
MAECPIDGSKIGFMGGWVLKDGEICNDCGKKVGFQKGDSKSNTAAHYYTIDEVRALIDKGEQFDPDHAQKVRDEETKRSQAGFDPTTIPAMKNRQEFLDKYGLNHLDPETSEIVNQIVDQMSSIGFSRVMATLNGLMDRYQVTMNQTQIEQNWVLIKQQDETNKLLRKLVNKQ